jgi:hypothetical protein
MATLVDRTTIEAGIDRLDLKESQKQFVKDRWLSYVVYWDQRAKASKTKYFILKTVVIVGSVITPALIGTVALPNLLQARESVTNPIQWIAFGLSLLVGLAAALEEFFRHGEIWREKRAAGEILKCEGWRFFQLAGKYKGKTHHGAFPDFASNVEDMIEHEIKDYFLVNRKKDEDPTPTHPAFLPFEKSKQVVMQSPPA